MEVFGLDNPVHIDYATSKSLYDALSVVHGVDMKELYERLKERYADENK
jgi:hypothetical protein